MIELTLEQKRNIKYLLLWITTLGQASVALYLPSLPLIAHDLTISSVEIKQTITFYIIGFGISPILYGPLSDKYGRKPILIISLLIALIGYAINIFSFTLMTFNIARLLQGLGCGGILICGRAIIRDVFSGRELASASSYLSMGFAIGFGVSPTLGGLIGYHFGWRYNFVFLLTVMVIVIAAIIRFLPETISDKHKDVRLNKFIKLTIYDYYKIILNVSFMRYLVGGFFAYSVVMAYNIMTPFLFQQVFMLTASEYGYMALFMGVPYYIAASVNRNLVLKFGIWSMFKVGYLFIILAGLMIISVCKFTTPTISLIILPMMLATFGQALIFSNTISGALQEFSSDLGGKASAIFSSIQMISVSIFSAFIAFIPNNSISLGIVILILGLLTMIVLLRSK